jgi:thioredoxin 1
MKSSWLGKILALLLGLGLVIQLLPALAQAPGPAQPRPEIQEFDRKLCPICREAEMIIQEVGKEFPGQFAVRRVYIGEEPNLFRRYKVAIVPTQVFVDTAGREVFRHEGVFPKDKLVQKLRELKFIENGKK